jgi:hypothetical protein
MLQQAQAAAAAQTDPTRPTRQALLQKTDLITPDAAEDDMPPPSYGDIHGEIRNKKTTWAPVPVSPTTAVSTSAAISSTVVYPRSLLLLYINMSRVSKIVARLLSHTFLLP